MLIALVDLMGDFVSCSLDDDLILSRIIIDSSYFWTLRRRCQKAHWWNSKDIWPLSFPKDQRSVYG